VAGKESVAGGGVAAAGKIALASALDSGDAALEIGEAVVDTLGGHAAKHGLAGHNLAHLLYLIGEMFEAIIHLGFEARLTLAQFLKQSDGVVFDVSHGLPSI
jgi:hypothetical protein